MFGCLSRLGCLVIALALAAAGWYWRATWIPKVRALVKAEVPAVTDKTWAPITSEGAQRTLAAMQRLSGQRGPAYITVTAADLASYLLGGALARVVESDSAPEAAVIEGKLFVRTRVKIADLGGAQALGPLASLFDSSEPVVIGGILEPVREGLAQYRLTDVSVKELKVPRAAMAKLVARWGRTVRPEGVAADALPLELPSYVADLRVSNGKITLYKKTE